MSKSWVPVNDDALDPFVNNFQTLIAANPTSYGLAAADATAITAAYTTWRAAYLAAINPTTRTKATVATKNIQKANVLGVVRRYGATIRVNRGISDALKIGLGIRIPDTTPVPIPPPSTQPVLTMLDSAIGSQSLKAADQTTPDKKARPAGTVGLLLFRAIDTAGTPTPPASAAQFLTFLTRNKFLATLAPADNGKVATYYARWANGRGELGPWSDPLVARIAA
jgi:hypothetical protein